MLSARVSLIRDACPSRRRPLPTTASETGPGTSDRIATCEHDSDKYKYWPSHARTNNPTDLTAAIPSVLPLRGQDQRVALWSTQQQFQFPKTSRKCKLACCAPVYLSSDYLQALLPLYAWPSDDRLRLYSWCFDQLFGPMINWGLYGALCVQTCEYFDYHVLALS